MSLDTSIPGTGVFSVVPAPKKPKRTRASASKVRTGCLTCSQLCRILHAVNPSSPVADHDPAAVRVRHVKCDEAKPFCKPCSRDKHKCDGYSTALQDKRPTPTCSTPPARRQYFNSVMKLSPPVDWDVSGTTLERLMFHHVHQCTVPDFGTATPLAKLWSNYILPLGYYSDSVKHAIIALGVAHRGFLENPYFDEKPSESALAFNDLAVRHHRKAVSETIQIMADPSPVNIRITLICCLVFVCYEIVRGQYDKAIQHLKAGSRVLESLHQAAISNQRDPLSVSTYDGQLAETVQKHFDQLCDITNMFTCIGMDTSMLIEDEIVPDLSYFTHPEADDERHTPFKTVSEARHRLHFVELTFSGAFDDCWFCGFDNCWHSAPSPCQAPEPSQDVQTLQKAAWDEASTRFKVWCSRFDLLQERLPGKLDPADLDELKALRFSRTSWEIFNAQDGPCAMKNSNMAELHALVDMAEEIVAGRDGLHRPRFALAADIVPSLSYICAFCDNVDLERRIVDVLRGMKRREGMWDSRELANLYDLVIQAKTGNQWKDEYNWETLPSLARMMSNMSLSGSGDRVGPPSPLTLL
ncbi:C6 zinc finger domain-containing protein [Colletotrichum orchidophilum]|uniref:C6 zinc finger domain-containing protein n=1 Tax=Colletotrichum orchidophilum TaxID=1209926 RepID=A0A1G4BHV3_9PEZI|nr:C6 zinc finger domain-containing protein [Colletotrichum orchidophilum]OHF00916.1 C6 zinc finger domain-containing protein [Colletotrichum orchidophilum]